MAYNARYLFFLLLVISSCLEIYARDIKFFSKVTKNTKANHESVSFSPVEAPTFAPSPSPEPEFVEHGYGLFGQDPYQNYEYPPTTTNPTKNTKFGEEELSKNNFKEFEMAYSNNGNGNGKQGMSDTRFLENGKYYYDVNQDVNDESKFLNKYENRNGNGNGNVRKGMSDTRFLENGKYYYDINEEGVKEGQNGHFNTYNNEFENDNFQGKYLYGGNNEEATKERKNGNFEINNNENENVYFKKQGISDTRFLDNGKYYYDRKNEEGNNNYNNNNRGMDVGFHNNNNVEYANSYYENVGNGNGKEGRGGNNYYRNENNVIEGRRGYNGRSPKKFPNEYDTMEEYDREQGYVDDKDEYVP